MERPKVGVSVIVKKEGEILFGKRISSHGANTWCFPGGHLEINESFEECAKRETLEEAGIRIKNVKFLTATNDIFKKEHKHYITIFLTADYASGKLRIMEPEKVQEWKWIDLKKQKMPTPLFLPIKNLLKQNIKS